MTVEQEKQISDYILNLKGQNQLRHMVFCLAFIKAQDVCPEVTCKELYEFIKQCWENAYE